MLEKITMFMCVDSVLALPASKLYLPKTASTENKILLKKRANISMPFFILDPFLDIIKSCFREMRQNARI